MEEKKRPAVSFFSKFALIIVLLVLIAFFAILSGDFFTLQNFSNILITNVAAGFLALGAIFILVIGDFDLSLGYNLCFCMVLGAFLGSKGCGTVVVFGSMILTGAFCGFINGILVVKFKISGFIVTLSVGLALSGIAEAVSGGGIICVSKPQFLLNFARNQIGPFSYCVIFFLVFSILLHFVLTNTPFGRHLFAVGISRKAAYMAGIKVGMVRILAFTCAGMFAGLGAIIMLGQLGAASSAYGISLLLPAYAVVFLSVTAFKPGYFNIPGVLLSILIVGIGTNGVQLIGVPTWGDYIFEGAILCFAMWLSTRFNIREKGKK